MVGGPGVLCTPEPEAYFLSPLSDYPLVPDPLLRLYFLVVVLGGKGYFTQPGVNLA